MKIGVTDTRVIDTYKRAPSIYESASEVGKKNDAIFYRLTDENLSRLQVSLLRDWMILDELLKRRKNRVSDKVEQETGKRLTSILAL